jgi:DNA-binding CsgD family transcriptional regulator
MVDASLTPTGRLFLRALTDHERKILVLVCAGFSNERIAERVSTSEQVIKNRMRLILQKAGRRNRCELILFVFRNGVVECPCKRRTLEMIESDTRDTEQRNHVAVNRRLPGIAIEVTSEPVKQSAALVK